MPVKSLLSEKAEAMLNEAIASELYASNLYKHIANQLQRLGYFGAQKFFASESADELVHYQGIVDFINDRGCVAKVPALPAMTESIETLRDALEAGFDTELQLERDYARWYSGCGDVIVQQFLLHYLELQRKSVGEYSDLISRLDRVGDDKCGVLLIDQELGA